MKGLIGKKLGMTKIFGPDGRDIPVTVIQAGPCEVTQIKTMEKDGYSAVQLGYGDRAEKKTTKPLQGHFKKAGVAPKRYLKEFPLKKGEKVQLGKEYTVSIFSEGDLVSVKGVSKGKGFTGVVKRHGFGGGPKTHGQSDRLRAPGSIGQSAYPSRVWPGMKMAGQHGNKNVLIKNLKVVKVDKDKNLLFVKGAVPGARNGIVIVTK